MVRIHGHIPIASVNNFICEIRKLLQVSKFKDCSLLFLVILIGNYKFPWYIHRLRQSKSCCVYIVVFYSSLYTCLGGDGWRCPRCLVLCPPPSRHLHTAWLRQWLLGSGYMLVLITTRANKSKVVWQMTDGSSTDLTALPKWKTRAENFHLIGSRGCPEYEPLREASPADRRQGSAVVGAKSDG